MTNQEFISTIKEVDNTSEHNEFLNSIIKSDPNRLIEIQKLIPKDQDYLLKNWQLRSIYERIIRASSYEIGLKNLNITNEVFNCCFRQKDKNLIASILSFKYDSLELINEQIKTNNDKLSELVIHELVSRGTDLSKSEIYEKIKEINHKSEFSSLSLKPSPLELKNDFPTYSLNGGGNGIAFGFQRNEEYKSFEKQAANDIKWEYSDQIKHAIEHWGGISIGYRGNYYNSLSIEEIVMSVPELIESKKIRIRELESSKAFSLIFNASSNGSAYTTGYYGAYGRLRTWKTLNSMTSNTEFKSSIETEKLIEEYKWYEFNTDSWFINEWLDLGIIGINEKKMEFGIIGATDTD